MSAGQALGYDGASDCFALTLPSTLALDLDRAPNDRRSPDACRGLRRGNSAEPGAVWIRPARRRSRADVRADQGRTVAALAAGRLPFWSDRFGLGVPLVAESHVAAFYPPNWVFYRFLNVATAYRLTMWLHMLGLVVATFAYARSLAIGRVGAALAAIVFALCGFQAVHAVHEPFYHLMLYLPLCLLLADRYAITGRLVWLAGLAIAWGAQITLGHFQIQMWTAGLVLVAGGWRALVGAGDIPRKLGRIAGLVVGLCWGAAVASVQLRLTWELTGVAGFVRPPQFLSNFLFPPAHWAQFALPEVFLGRPLGTGDLYWGHHGTTPGEACAYVGVVPLILAFVGALAAPRDRALTPWRLIVPMSLALATMPGWWPDGFFVLLQLPGLGWFRAGALHPPDQPGAGASGWPWSRSLGCVATVLARPGTGDSRRRGRVGLVDPLLGGRGRISDWLGG